MANLVTGLAVISDRRTKDTFQSEKLTTVSKLKTGTVTKDSSYKHYKKTLGTYWS